MLFQQAVREAETLLLFDLHSQRRLRELSQAAAPDSQDWRLLRTTEVAIYFYNSRDALAGTQLRGIENALEVVGQLRQGGADRLTIMMALRLEMDLLLRRSALGLEFVKWEQQQQALFTKGDQRALEVGEVLLAHFPSLNPLPLEFQHLLCPLMPPYAKEVLAFYQSSSQEQRQQALLGLLKTHRRHLLALVGLLRAKRFLASSQIRIGNLRRARQLFGMGAEALSARAEEGLDGLVQLAYDLVLPGRFSPRRLSERIAQVHKAIQGLREQGARPEQLVESLVQMGILRFLHRDSEAAIAALVEALRKSRQLPAELKTQRQHRHEEFADLPFMLGVSFLRLHGLEAYAATPEAPLAHRQQSWLLKAACSLLQAITLQPDYHQAYLNLALVYALEENAEALALLLRHMQSQFGGKLEAWPDSLFVNLGLIAQKKQPLLQPEAVQWLLISLFCAPAEGGQGLHLLQEQRTLYTLNAHRELATSYHQYKREMKAADPAFMKTMENSRAHSAMLFYMAHGFCFYAAQQQNGTGSKSSLDYAAFHRSLLLNAEALYYHPQNASARRLALTHQQILTTIWKRLAQGWQEMGLSQARAAVLYQEMLQVRKLAEVMAERLGPRNIPAAIPQLQMPPALRAKIDTLVQAPQRLRLQKRADAEIALRD